MCVIPVVPIVLKSIKRFAKRIREIMFPRVRARMQEGTPETINSTKHEKLVKKYASMLSL